MECSSFFMGPKEHIKRVAPAKLISILLAGDGGVLCYTGVLRSTD